MRHLRTVFVGILYSRRLILDYSNHLEGRQTLKNHLVHMGTHGYACNNVINFHLSPFFCGFYFRGSVRKNHENLHPAKISRYTLYMEAKLYVQCDSMALQLSSSDKTLLYESDTVLWFKLHNGIMYMITARNIVTLGWTKM